MGEGTLKLVVIGDSTSFTDAKGPQMPAEPSLYPNVVAAHLEESLDRPVSVNVIARAGTDVREAHRAVLKDRHLMFEVLMGCDAVIIGVGSIDHAPVGVPPVFEEIARWIPNAGVRRVARRSIHWTFPRVVRATKGRMTHTPRALFERLYDGLLFQVRALTHGAPGVVLGPTSHAGTYYGNGHPQYAERSALQEQIARKHGFPVVQPWPFAEPLQDRLNPDGIHWPAEVHAAVGEALAIPLVAQLKGDRPSPGIPW